MKNLFFLVTFLLISTTVFCQNGPNNPEFVPSELLIEIINTPPSFSLSASVILSSMAFSGEDNTQKVYSNIFTNRSAETQPITGGSHLFSNSDPLPWNIEHIEDGQPTYGKLWIGYGLYKITIGDFVFYLDYLDSSYPYYMLQPDIVISYDYSSSQVSVASAYYTVYPLMPEGNNYTVIRVWSDLFGKGLYPEATDFYVHGTVPIDPSQVEEKLFTKAFVDGNITVSAGKKFTIDRSTYPDPIAKNLQPMGLKFNTSTLLTVSGTLIAKGLGTKTISFERSGTTGSWGSIIFDGSGASNSILDNVVMSNGTEIQCLNGANVTIENSILDHNIEGIYVYNSAPQIKFNQILEPRDYGIYGEASGLYITIKDNTITKTQSESWSNYHNFEGINFTNNTGSYITHNNISGFYWGGYFGGGSNIIFNNNPGDPNNQFLDNLTGLASGWGSTVLAGLSDGSDGYNSSHNNSSYDVYSYVQSNLQAQYNYWGGGQPQSYVDGTSTLNTSNILTTDPWSGGGSAAFIGDNDLRISTSSANTNGFDKLSSSNKNNFADITSGISLEKQGKINDAVNHYKAMVESDNNVNFALTSLVNFRHKYNRDDIFKYLKELSKSSKHSALATKFIGDIYVQDNQFDDAIDAYNTVINNYSNDFQGINSRFEKMFAYLHVKKDSKKAKEILSEIKSMNLTEDIWDMRIKTAEHFLDDSNPGIKADNSIALKKDNISVENKNNEFVLFENYPNPFNPTTVINYQLPKASFVTLKIYDMIGKEVKSLVNEYQESGRYNVTFNANNLTSGVYIYRIQAGNFTATKKLVLMK